MKYVALPEEIYIQVRRFVGSQSYDIVKELIAVMDKYNREAQLKTEDEKKDEVLPDAASETAVGISSNGN